jgi:hypothetical protein
MNAKKLVLIGLFLTLALAACGKGGGGDEPAKVAENVMKALGKMDIDGASEFFCEARRTELEDALTGDLGELEAMGMDADELLDAFKITLTDMKYEEKSQDGDKAIVHITGSMKLEFDSDKLKDFFKKAAEAAGETVTDEELDFIVEMIASSAAQEEDLDEDVELIKEDGKWVVCDELVLPEGF